MDWKDCIIFKKPNNEGRIAIPRTSIRGVGSKMKTNYSKQPSIAEEVTILNVDIQIAIALGYDARHHFLKDQVYGIEIDEKLEIVLGILSGSPAAGVLF